MVVNKSKSAFKTIAEAAEDLGVATHVLRFWETKFPQIQPMKRAGGRRYYRPDDMEILRAIKNYLYEKRYTIEGVQKIFKSNRLKDIVGETIQNDFFEESFINDSIDGAILASRDPDHIIKVFKKRGIPIVLFQNETGLENVGMVTNDDYGGMMKIMKHLIEEKGYDHF